MLFSVLYDIYERIIPIGSIKPLFHLSQKPTRKLAASAFKYSDWRNVLAASLRVVFCGEWKRALICETIEFFYMTNLKNQFLCVFLKGL